MQTQKGITLIALVITIIVLLILAGVSINLVVGQNGILNRAQTAVIETKKASVLEEAQMILSEWQTDYLVNKIKYDGRSETTTSGATVACLDSQCLVIDSENSKENQAPEAAIVNAVGGFYVSRYEIGIVSSERTNGVQSGWTTSYIYSQKGMEPIRNITQTDSLKLANDWKLGTNYQSGLITGTQWDTMCKFIGWDICNSDGTLWGNYYNVESKSYTENIGHSGIDANYSLWYVGNAVKKDANKKAIFATGSFINNNAGNTIKKNIYDVAGNVHEFTTETTNKDARVLRGGGAADSGYSFFPTYRHGGVSEDNPDWDIGFRAVLYVKE